MEIRFPDELTELRTTVRRFVNQYLLPHELELEETGDLPDELWARLEKESRDLGLNALAVPEKYGGIGLDLLGQLAAAEEMGRVAVGFRHLVGSPLGAHALATFGTPEQVENYLIPWIEGKRRGSWAATEPEAGSDLGNMRVTAEFKSGSWLIDGTKHFCTGLDRSDFVITYASTNKGKGAKGLTAFLLDLNHPGISIGRPQKMMGRGGLHTYVLHYDNVVVPDTARLGPIDAGIKVLIGNVSQIRLLLGGHCIGVGQRLIEMAQQWGNQRVQFGRPIGEFQALQWYLADAATELQSIRMMTYHAAWLVSQKREAIAETAAVKAAATEMAFRVCDAVMQIFGGSGYCKELPIEAIFRAVRLLRIAEGSSEIQRMLIDRSLAKGWRPLLA